MAPMVATKGYSLNVNAQGERLEWAMKLVRYMTSEQTQRRMATELKTLPSRQRCSMTQHFWRTRHWLYPPSKCDAADPCRWCRSCERFGMPRGRTTRQSWAARLRRPKRQRRCSAMPKSKLSNSIEMSSRAGRQGCCGCWVGEVSCVAGLAIKKLRRIREGLSQESACLLVCLPTFLIVFLTVVFPFVFNIVLSFSNMSMKHFRDWQIVGFQNYQDVFIDPAFLPVLLKTIAWTVINVFFHVVIGVSLAVALNGPVRGKRIYRLLLIIPWAVPAYITALTWQGMFDLKYGAINLLLGQVGIEEVNWLGDPGWAFAACFITNIWLGFPFMMVIALGGMQSIPQELYEAARIDRASRWHQFWHITVPMLRPVLLPAITLGVIWTFNKLDIIWLVSDGGKPNDQTHILVSYVYKAVFNLYRYGYGAALSMVIFAMLLVFSLVFLRKTHAAEGVQ